ncbi:MAG: hypothetical protein LCI03_12435 [Actinobacteria bacterium]|nr:hypothetical protein [Actinomycetota bacterium]
MGEELSATPSRQDRRPRRRRLAWSAAWAAWGLGVVWLIAHLLLVEGLGCPPYLNADSVYGEPGWQWLPPGTTCTYYADPVEESGPIIVTRPSAGPAVVALLLMAMPVVARASRRTDGGGS